MIEAQAIELTATAVCLLEATVVVPPGEQVSSVTTSEQVKFNKKTIVCHYEQRSMINI